MTGAAALDERDLAVITQIRLPRVVNALIVGATLAVSGAVFQTLFRNPLADPYFLGVSSGASLGVTAAMMAGASSAGVIPAAFVGGMAAVGIAYLVATGAGSHPTVIVLAGVAVSAFAGAVQSYLQIRDLKKLEGVYVWLLGNLGRAGWKDIATVLCVVVPCWCAILAASKALDVLTLGGSRSPDSRDKRPACASSAHCSGDASNVGSCQHLRPHRVRGNCGATHVAPHGWSGTRVPVAINYCGWRWISACR